MKLCEQCLAEFNGHGNRRYCSQECYTEAGKTRNREKYWDDGKQRKYMSWPDDVVQKEYEVWHAYGLYLAEYEAMFAEGCAICGGMAEHLDHNHKTGQPRAALCRLHNIAVGWAEIETAAKVQEYLELWK